MSNTPEILQKITSGNLKTYLQMGGQGAYWLNEASKLYRQDRMARYFDVMISALMEVHHEMGDTVGFEKGFQPDQWIKDPESIPSEDYLERTSISMPMIQVTQLAHYEYLNQNGYNLPAISEHIRSIAGHSQGIITATFLSLGLSGDDYYDALKQYSKFLYYLAVRTQQAFPFPEPTKEEIELSAELNNDPPSPMTAVVGGDHEFIQQMVNAINTDLPDNEKIYISLYNTPTNRVLSSTRSSLVAFQKKYQKELQEHELKYTYIRTSCPFHSPYMSGIWDVLKADLDKIGFNFSGADMKVPIYSFSDGHNLQTDENLAEVTVRDIADNPLHWDKAIAPLLKETDETIVIDFGPGKVSQRLTQAFLKEKEKENTTIYAMAVPRDQKTLFKAE